MKSFKKLIGGLEKRFVLTSILAPLAIIVEVVLEVLIPLLMAKIIDQGIASQNLGLVARLGLIMVSLALLALVFGSLSGIFSAFASLGFAKNLRKKLFSKVQDFSFANIDSFSTASLVTRLTTDVTNVQQLYQMALRMFVRAPVMFVSATIMSFYINPSLARVFFVAIPFIFIPMIFIMRKAFPRFSLMMKKYDALNARVQENVSAIRVVKTFVREDHENKKFQEAADQVRSTQVSAEKLIILGMPLMQLVMYLSIIAIFWFGGNMIVNESLLTGELISFISYLSQVLFSLMMISMIFVMLVISRASVQRIVEVLDAEVDLKDCIEVENEKTKTLHIKDGSIQFSEVFFSYSNKKDKCILKDINIEIDSGMTVGIIGSTGSSKTSLVQLIPRLYDVLSGAVKVGGIDVRDIPLKELRGQVAMVLQKNTLFSGTIKENLKWGNENASDAEIKKVCQIAQADDFVSNFPEGYETKLGQGGVNLSGGQKQRLSIARALLKKPKILILDDSTSAVDTATDKAIRSALKEGFADITKIIIAQRIDSIKESDLILVMDEGKLSAQGRHEDLLEESAIYREVYESQQAGALIDLDEEE